MKLSLDDIRKDHFLIKACGPDGITVNDLCYKHSIVVCLEQAPRAWLLDSLDRITSREVETLLHGTVPEIVLPEIILIGTGTKHSFPPITALIPLLEANIGYEIMDTAAACRTYNILASEGRRVMAGLILPV